MVFEHDDQKPYEFLRFLRLQPIFFLKYQRGGGGISAAESGAAFLLAKPLRSLPAPTVAKAGAQHH